MIDFALLVADDGFIPHEDALSHQRLSPTIYGGAGMHVEYLSRKLAQLMPVEVRCYGKDLREQRIDTPSLKATGHGLVGAGYTAPKPLHSVFGALQPP